MFHSEWFGEVRAGALSLARAVVEPDIPLRNDDVVASFGPDHCLLLAVCEVVWRNGEFGLEESFVDCAELSDREASEVDWPDEPIQGFIDEEGRECGADLFVRESVVGECSTRRTDGGVGREEGASVGGYGPVLSAFIDGGPKRLNVVPQVGSVRVERCAVDPHFGEGLC